MVLMPVSGSAGHFQQGDVGRLFVFDLDPAEKQSGINFRTEMVAGFLVHSGNQ